MKSKEAKLHKYTVKLNFDYIEERKVEKHPGNCSRGKCTGELACKELENNFYSCVCPHDSKAPNPDGSCPRYTVPLQPGLIPNVLPPSNNNEETNTSSRLPDTTPSVQHSIAQPTTTNQIDYYVVGGGVSLFLVSMLLLGLILRRKCCSRSRHDSIASPVNLKSNLLLSKRYVPNPQYTACAGTGVPLLKKETLKFKQEIGEGCFGKVFKGHYILDGGNRVEVVAIKVLKENASKEAEDDFLREVEIMSAFRHPNILSLLGVVPREGNLNPMMVFEFMTHGDLAELLRSQKKTFYDPEEEEVPILSDADLLHIALQIARGMSYLANQRFVHRDLACRNCLVSQGPVVKIADFGMSRDVYTCDYYKVILIGGSRLLPVRWMSPESVVYGRFTLESDIWSYGVVLWEIYSFARQPYFGHTNEEVVKFILDGIMLIPPTDCPAIVCDLMKHCWKTEPRDRIRFVNICDKLEVAYQECVCTESHIENEVKGKCKSEDSEPKDKSGKTLPRPPPMPLLLQEDVLDTEGYLLAREMEAVQYLETLPG
ncbi:BDNF/NT-3 growth factors receptor-like isoform X3 [Coccinella septempunctata]|uniref:BDNF/NT-3 growth factors receptor-like isoform X3 n=1 Tax=Coccinella septempunctata TaxID=41139 RepID=UPI001D06DB79|nr:BDNF/NT-3 growth factors receptor-like isoform X3 [Coccinella septempunctata]